MWLLTRWNERRRPCRSVTSAQHVGAHNEELVGIKSLSGTNKVIPPSDLQRLAPLDSETWDLSIDPRGVLRPTKSMEEKDRVITSLIQGAVRLERDGEISNLFSLSQCKGAPGS